MKLDINAKNTLFNSNFSTNYSHFLNVPFIFTLYENGNKQQQKFIIIPQNKI